jgi:selenocysteine lyase/cysteine desulfurase
MVTEERSDDLVGDAVAEIYGETEGTSAAAHDFHSEFSMEQMHSLRTAFNRMLQLVSHEQTVLNAASTLGTRMRQHALRRWKQQHVQKQNMAKAQARSTWRPGR